MNANARPPALPSSLTTTRSCAGLIADYLTPMGYEVSMAHTGPEGASPGQRAVPGWR